MGLIKDLRQHFEDRGLIQGTQDIIDLAVAASMVGTAAYLVGRQIYVHHVVHSNSQGQYSGVSPIEMAKQGSSVDLMREIKEDSKKFKKMMKELEEEAVENLSRDRNKFFRNLPYEERRNLLNMEGLLEAEEKAIIKARKTIQDRTNTEVETRRSAGTGFFKELVGIMPGYSDAEQYYLRRGRESYFKYCGSPLKKDPPTAASANRFIVRPNGTITPDTYEDKKARVDAIPDEGHNLKPIPSYMNKLQFLPQGVQDAYLDMRGQLSRMTDARRTPFEREVHRNMSNKEKAKEIEKAWKDRSNLMWEAQETWHGNQNLIHEKLKYRTLAGDDGGDRFISEMEKWTDFLRENRVDMNSLMDDEESVKALDGLVEKIQASKNAKTFDDEMLDEENREGLISRFGGVHPKDIPYFDNGLYDSDYVSKPVTIAKDIGGMKHLDFLPGSTGDLSKASYEPFHKRAMARRRENHQLRAKLQRDDLWNRLNWADPLGSNFYEGIDEMNRDLFTMPMNRAGRGILDRDLPKMKKKDKKKKKDDDDFHIFDDFDFSDKKSKKSKGKKFKDKDKDKSKKSKGKGKKSSIESSFLDDDKFKHSISSSTMKSIFGGVSKTTMKSFEKDLKKMRKGRFYSG